VFGDIDVRVTIIVHGMSLLRTAALAVDVVALTVLDDQLAVLVVARHAPPFRDRLSLPGGFLLDDEDLADAAERELDETGLESSRVHLEQLATYGAPGRDPRGRVVTVAYLALVPGLSARLTGVGTARPEHDDPDDDEVDPDDDEVEFGAAEWVPVDELLDDPRSLAFDHHRILTDAVERARAKLEYSPLGTAFCPDEFTVGDLRRVYEAVWDADLDPRNFHRKVSGTADFVVETGRVTSGESGRPARLYRRGDADLLHPAMLRPPEPPPQPPKTARTDGSKWSRPGVS